MVVAGNQFTQAYDADGNRRRLPAPTKVADYAAPSDPYVAATQSRDRSAARSYAASRTGRWMRPNSGELGRPEVQKGKTVAQSMANVSPYEAIDLDSPGWDMSSVPVLQQLNRKYNRPEVTQGPAINEPHVASDNQMVVRRMEDLTSAERVKALKTMGAHGSSVASQTREKTNANDRADMRAILNDYGTTMSDESSRFGDGVVSRRAEGPTMESGAFTAGQNTINVEGNSRPYGTRFYGGDFGGSGPADKINEAVGAVESQAKDREHARGIAAATIGPTSPKNKFEQLYKDPNKAPTYPNINAAKMALEYAAAGGAPADNADIKAEYHSRKDIDLQGGVGMYGNIRKGADLAGQMLREGKSLSDVFDVSGNEKAAPFTNALVMPSSSESYNTSDVLDTQAANPHLSARKQPLFDVVDKGTGERVDRHAYRAEDVTGGQPDPSYAKGRLAHFGYGNHEYRRAKDDAGKALLSDAPSEELLAKGGGAIHAVQDYATRKATANMGLVPSVNHAQAVNQAQEAAWAEQKLNRPDMTEYTPDRMYPGTSGMSADDFDVFSHIKRTQNGR